MSNINPKLIQRLKKELGLERSRIYDLISVKMGETHLDRHLAAIVVASENGIGIAKYATPEDLSIIRGVGRREQPIQSKVSQSEVLRPTIKRIIAVPEPITSDLNFITTKELRQILERDIAELNIARSHDLGKTAKTSMILCGSITETLLLDRLLKNKHEALTVAGTLPDKISKNPEDWDLYHMVTIAINMRPPLLPDDAIIGAQQLRKWRNLIHPGRELKDARIGRIKPTKARARNAIAYLQFIVDELNT